VPLLFLRIMTNQLVLFPGGERPGTRVNILLVILSGFLLNAGIFSFLYVLKGTFIRDLFIGRNEVDMSRLIFQFLTMYMFSLSIVTVVLKRYRLKSEYYALWEIPIPQDLDMRDEARLVTTYEQITSLPNWTKSIVHTRVARVLAMWINSRDFERTIQYARENSELDYLGSDSSFRANRLYIWAMPLLGFLGTVYGVSYGIGGFAEFLTGGNITGEDITNQVGIITQGLAIAFYTTLVGLFAAGISAFPAMAAERREESLLASIDELIEERITARMPSSPGGESPVHGTMDAMREYLRNISDALAMPIRDLVNAVNEGFRQMPSPANYQQVFARAIAEAGELLNQKYGQLQAGYQESIAQMSRELCSRLEGVAADFQASAETLGSGLSQQARSLEAQYARTTEQQTAAFRGQLDQIQHLGDQQQARWKESMDAWVRHNMEAQSQLKASSSALADASGKAAKGVEEALSRLTQQLQSVMDIGRRIDELLKVSKSVEISLAGVAGHVEFSRLMADLRKHLETTDDLMKQLTKPRQFVFKETR